MSEVRVLEVDLGDGSALLIQTPAALSPAPDGLVGAQGNYGGRSSAAADVRGEGRLKLDDAIAAITKVGLKVRDVVETVKPHGAEVELAFDFSVRSGVLTAVIVEGETHAAIKVKLRWGAS